jgi:hypothetical protein
MTPVAAPPARGRGTMMYCPLWPKPASQHQQRESCDYTVADRLLEPGSDTSFLISPLSVSGPGVEHPTLPKPTRKTITLNDEPKPARQSRLKKPVERSNSCFWKRGNESDELVGYLLPHREGWGAGRRAGRRALLGVQEEMPRRRWLG